MGCKRTLSANSWFNWCGETDMGQTLPALCVECGGNFELMKEEEVLQREIVRDENTAYEENWERENPEEAKIKNFESIVKYIYGIDKK